MIDIKIGILIIIGTIVVGLALSALTDIKLVKEVWKEYRAYKKRKKK